MIRSIQPVGILVQLLYTGVHSGGERVAGVEYDLSISMLFTKTEKQTFLQHEETKIKTRIGFDEYWQR